MKQPINILKSLVKKYAPLLIKQKLFSAKLYRALPHLKKLKKGKVAVSSAPVVLLSLPRSGSSWLGSILGVNGQVRYLREPVTTSYMLGKKDRISVFSPELDKTKTYVKLLQNALSGIPTGSLKVTPYIEQWRDITTPKRLIIKETNPLALSYYLQANCQLIYLSRHPYAIAESYSALNWRSDRLIEKKFSQEELKLILKHSPKLQSHSYAFQQGFLFGWIEAKVLSQLNHGFLIIRYEDICNTPEKSIAEILETINLPMDNMVVTALKNSINGQKQEAGKFCLTRDKSSIGKILIDGSNINKYTELMTGYEQAYQYFIVNNNYQLKPLYQREESFISREEL